MKKKVQAQVAKTILQEDVKVEINGRNFVMPPITLATLIMASEKIAELPEFEMDSDRAFSSVLGNARHCKSVGHILAIFILGAKAILKRPFGRKRVKKLGEALALQYTPAQLHSLVKGVLTSIDVTDFFGITTFLQGINLTEPKKVVKTTASGQ